MIFDNALVIPDDFENLITKQDSEIFEEMKTYLHTLEIDACLIIIASRKSSFCIHNTTINDYNSYLNKSGDFFKKIPVFDLYVGSTQNFNKHFKDINEYKNNDNSIKNAILIKWYELVQSYFNDISDLFDEDMWINLVNAEAFILERVIRRKKADIIEALNILDPVTPKKIYCSSLPSYEIIFNSLYDYLYAKNIFKEITVLIKEIIENELQLQPIHASMQPLKINFWHPEMKDYNGYGLARED